MNHHVKLHLRWDDEANVWFIENTNVIGLVAEADTLRGLLRKVSDVAPDLMKLNGQKLPSV